MQVPAAFQYEKAASVEHAIELLTRYGPEARPVAGGHSLLPMMKLRLAQPEALIDIGGLDDLARIRVDGDELSIGAMVRHAGLLASPDVGAHVPLLHDAERVIADPLVRNRGTVGGSLCQADPSEDLSAAFSALRATLVAQNGDGLRTIPIREFFTGPYETALRPAELLVEIRVPLGCHASAYRKVERRAGDWSVAAAGAVLRVDGGTVTEAGIGLAAVGAPRFVAAEAEEFLRGGPPDEARFAEAGRIAARECRPFSDQRGPLDYKRHLAGELTTRALRAAAARVRGQEA